MSVVTITPRPGSRRIAGGDRGGQGQGLEMILATVGIGIAAAVAVKGMASARDPGTSPHSAAERQLRQGAAILGASALADSALLHFRRAFHNPAMFLPVTIPPVAGLAVCGTALHAWGVSRNMGGWKNWRQNMLAGPPLPARASFTGLALAGLAALRLLDRRKDRP